MLRLLKQKEYLRNFKEGEDNLTFLADFILTNKEEYPIKIVFDEHFPTYLPEIFINGVDLDKIDHPHIDRNGKICFLDTSGLVWSREPSDCLDLVFGQVEKLLLLDEQKLKVEYHKEFDYFILSLDNSRIASSIGENFDDLEEIGLVTKKTKPISFVKKDTSSQDILNRKLFDQNNEVNSTGIFIRLSKQYHGKIPKYEKFWSTKEISNIIKTFTTKETISCLNNMSVPNKQNYYFLVEFTLLTGRKALLGFWYKRFKKKAKIETIPLIDPDADDYFTIIPLYIQSFDSTLLERSGGNIIKDNVLLVGCGSLGSNILFLLSQAGFANITIVDNDLISVENTCRHFLGANYGVKRRKKVEALKEEIELRYPLTFIRTFDKDILQLINDGIISFDNYDLVIVAIGDPNIEKWINREILKTTTPAIFSWIEPYGLGGHSLLINNSGKGCYECIFTNEIYNEVSFAEIGRETYIKNITGCGGSFTPYGNIDAMQTALIATRLALSYINHQINGNILASWKGSDSAFLSAGYKTTQRFNEMNNTITMETMTAAKPNCVCSHEENINDYNL